jgi:hypothetical protein
MGGMTTRQSLMRRRWQTALSILVLLLTVGVYKSAQQDVPVWNPVFAALLVTALAYLVWNVCQTPCLNCQKPLGWVALPWILHPVEIAAVSPHCPNCDVSIDRDFPTQ